MEDWRGVVTAYQDAGQSALNMSKIIVVLVGSAVLKEFFEGLLYHHKRNHKQFSRGWEYGGPSSWKICLAFKVPIDVYKKPRCPTSYTTHVKICSGS